MSLKNRIDQLLSGEGENYIFPFFWQHGEEEAVLREYMQKIHEANIGAVCVESRPHPDYAGAGWWRDMDIILEEAKRLNMKVWILDDQHFPTGYAVGAMEHAPMELHHQYLDYNEAEIWGPRPQMELEVSAFAKPQPTPPWMMPLPGEPDHKFHDDHLFRVVACPVEEKGRLGAPVDLTMQVREGKLIWDVPEGYWKIYVIYLTRDARGRNNYINFLDHESCRILIDAVYEPHYEKYGSLFGSVIAGFFSDEPPIGNTFTYTRGDLIGKPDMPLSWSKEMEAAMNREYGPGWEKELPYLWVRSSEDHRAARIRTAYMNAVSKLVSECFSDQIGQWCEAHGVEYIGHMLEDCDSSANLGPSMGHFFRGLSGQHMAGIDNIGGQVLPGGTEVHRFEPDMCQDSAGFYHYMLGRMGASMAAIDPKKKGRCMCENFGAYGWRCGVRLEKYLMDHFLARGVNYYVPHAFSPKAFPDPDCPPHFYAHGENPQFKAFGALMAYTNRICHLIDGGLQEAPVALLYHGESQWGGAYESNIFACRYLTQNQINFLVIPADVFEKENGYCTDHEKRNGSNTYLDKENGILSVNGIACRALVISGCQYVTKAAAQFVLEASAAGFPVIFTEYLPDDISDVTKEESRRMITELSACLVVPAGDLPEALEHLHCRTVVPEQQWKHLTAYHYQNEGDVYLLLNEDAGKTFEQWVTIPGLAGKLSTEQRKNGELPEVISYDAWDNKLRSVRTRIHGGELQVYVMLAPLEMTVLLANLPQQELLFAAGRKPCCINEWKNAKTDTLELPLNAWTVSRCEAKQYPEFAEEEEADLVHGMAILHPEFSGFYRYETVCQAKDLFSWQKDSQADTEFGAELLIEDAYESAEVFVNGVSAGLRTAQPYRYEIGDLLKDGDNQIVIEVATTLERKATAIGAGEGGMGIPSPMAPTGIVGSVTLITYIV